MDSSGLKIFSAMKNKLQYMSERQRVLAQNIANANTPGYKAKDVNMDFGQLVSGKTKQIALATTNAKHLKGGSGAGGSNFKSVEIESTEITPNGNNVVLEEELLKMQNNNMDYQTTTQLYQKMVSMMKTALGESGR